MPGTDRNFNPIDVTFHVLNRKRLTVDVIRLGDAGTALTFRDVKLSNEHVTPERLITVLSRATEMPGGIYMDVMETDTLLPVPNLEIARIQVESCGIKTDITELGNIVRTEPFTPRIQADGADRAAVEIRLKQLIRDGLTKYHDLSCGPEVPLAEFLSSWLLDNGAWLDLNFSGTKPSQDDGGPLFGLEFDARMPDGKNKYSVCLNRLPCSVNLFIRAVLKRPEPGVIRVMGADGREIMRLSHANRRLTAIDDHGLMPGQYAQDVYDTFIGRDAVTAFEGRGIMTYEVRTDA